MLRCGFKLIALFDKNGSFIVAINETNDIPITYNGIEVCNVEKVDLYFRI